MESPKSGRVSPSNEIKRASHNEEHINRRRSMRSRQVPTGASQLKVSDNLQAEESVKCELKGEMSAYSVQNEGPLEDCSAFKTGGQEGGSFTGKKRLSYAKEWATSPQTMAPSTDDDQKKTDLIKNCPVSPTAPTPAPTTSLLGPFGCTSEDGKKVDATLTRVDGSSVNPAGMTKMVTLSEPRESTVFSGMGLKVIPVLGTYSSLETLNISINSFVHITPGCLPKSLRSLDISHNKIVVIEGLKELTRLRVLNLSFNKISRVGSGLSKCISLKELYLAGNKISEVEGLHRLSRLILLDMSFNKLTTIKSIGRIALNSKSLRSFNILGNDVYSNVGHEKMKRFVTDMCIDLVYLNKQRLTPVSSLGKDLDGSCQNTAKKSKQGRRKTLCTNSSERLN